MLTPGYRCGGGTQEQPGADACGAEYCQVPCSAPGHFHWQRRRHNLVSLKINYHFLQLRYLQTLNNIAAENNSTVVFPVPMDLFTKMVEVIPDTSGDELRELFVNNL